MSRRQLLAAVGGAAGAVALSGCSGAAGKWGFSGNSDSSRVHLTYALWDTYEQQGYQKSIDRFTADHPHISVTIQQIPYGNYQPKITASYISGNAPDLFWVNTPFLANWIDQGILTDLTERIRADNIDLSVYYPSLVELHRHDGRLYGLPKDWDTICFYYNRTLFKKLGVKPPKELSWAPDGSGNFVDFLRTITVDGRGRNAAHAGFDAGDIRTYAVGIVNDPQAGYGSYLPANGGAFIPQSYASKVSLDTPANRQTFDFIVNHLRAEHVQAPGGELGTNASGDTALTLFSQGRLALFQNGDWNTSSLSQLGSGFEIGTIRLPAGPQGNYSVFNGLTDGINTNTAHPDEAWELAKWLGGEQSQRIMGAGGYIWPAIQKLDPLFQRYWKSKNVDVSAFLDAAQDKTVLYPVTQGMAEAVTDVTSALGPVFFNQRSVASGLAAAQQVADYRITAAKA